MPRSIFVIHYRVTHQGNEVTGYTTITSDPPVTSLEASNTLARSLRATAPASTIEILATKEITEEAYNTHLEIIRVR